MLHGRFHLSIDLSLALSFPFFPPTPSSFYTLPLCPAPPLSLPYPSPFSTLPHSHCSPQRVVGEASAELPPHTQQENPMFTSLPTHPLELLHCPDRDPLLPQFVILVLASVGPCSHVCVNRTHPAPFSLGMSGV